MKYLCGHFYHFRIYNLKIWCILCNTVFLSQKRLQDFFKWLIFRRLRSTKGILILGAGSFHCKTPWFLTGLDNEAFYLYSNSMLRPSLWQPLCFYPLEWFPLKQLEIRLTVFAGHSENHVLDIYCYDVNIVLIGAGLTTCKFGCTFDSRVLVYTCFSNQSRRLGHITWHWCNCMEMAVCSTSCYLFKCNGNITLLAISV